MAEVGGDRRDFIYDNSGDRDRARPRDGRPAGGGIGRDGLCCGDATAASGVSANEHIAEYSKCAHFDAVQILGSF